MENTAVPGDKGFFFIVSTGAYWKIWRHLEIRDFFFHSVNWCVLDNMANLRFAVLSNTHQLTIEKNIFLLSTGAYWIF